MTQPHTSLLLGGCIERFEQGDITVQIFDNAGTNLYRNGTHFNLSKPEVEILRACCQRSYLGPVAVTIHNTQLLVVVNGSRELLGTGEFNTESRDYCRQLHDIDGGYVSESSVSDGIGHILEGKSEQLCNDTLFSTDIEENKHFKKKKETPCTEGSRKLTLAVCCVGSITVVVCREAGQSDQLSALGCLKEVKREVHSHLRDIGIISSLETMV